jgi:SnoaL-like domain
MQAKPVARAEEFALDAAAVCETLKRGLEERDAELAASVYADDVEFLIVNRNYPPSNPLLRKGRAAVLAMYQDICSREMMHKVTSIVVGPEGFAIRESCQYPDGGRVLGHVIAEMRDGKIVRQFNVDCWDE